MVERRRRVESPMPLVAPAKTQMRPDSSWEANWRFASLFGVESEGVRDGMRGVDLQFIKFWNGSRLVEYGDMEFRGL